MIEARPKAVYTIQTITESANPSTPVLFLHFGVDNISATVYYEHRPVLKRHSHEWTFQYPSKTCRESWALTKHKRGVCVFSFTAFAGVPMTQTDFIKEVGNCGTTSGGHPVIARPESTDQRDHCSEINVTLSQLFSHCNDLPAPRHHFWNPLYFP